MHAAPDVDDVARDADPNDRAAVEALLPRPLDDFEEAMLPKWARSGARLERCRCPFRGWTLRPVRTEPPPPRRRRSTPAEIYAFAKRHGLLAPRELVRSRTVAPRPREARRPAPARHRGSRRVSSRSVGGGGPGDPDPELASSVSRTGVGSWATSSPTKPRLLGYVLRDYLDVLIERTGR
jgi:hypothetical protein